MLMILVIIIPIANYFSNFNKNNLSINEIIIHFCKLQNERYIFMAKLAMDGKWKENFKNLWIVYESKHKWGMKVWMQKILATFLQILSTIFFFF